MGVAMWHGMNVYPVPKKIFLFTHSVSICYSIQILECLLKTRGHVLLQKKVSCRLVDVPSRLRRGCTESQEVNLVFSYATVYPHVLGQMVSLVWSWVSPSVNWGCFLNLASTWQHYRANGPPEASQNMTDWRTYSGEIKLQREKDECSRKITQCR